MAGVRCDKCNTWATKTPDSDGVRRCITHSTNDSAKDARARAAQAGRTGPQPNRRPKRDPRIPSNPMKALPPAGIDRVPPLEPSGFGRLSDDDPVLLATKGQMRDFLQRAGAGLLAGALNSAEVTAAATLVRAATELYKIEEPIDPAQEVGGFLFEVLPAASSTQAQPAVNVKQADA